MPVHLMAKEIDLWFPKLTLFQPDNQAIGLKTFKENLQMFFVFLIGSTSNQYIIQVVEDEIEAMENLIHKVLKCLCCVFQSKWHA